MVLAGGNVPFSLALKVGFTGKVYQKQPRKGVLFVTCKAN